MRPLILTALLMIAPVTQATAQSMPNMPNTTYPQPGTFCGLFTLCPKADLAKDRG